MNSSYRTSSENISFDTVGSANVESATGNLLDSNEDDFYESYGIKVLPSFLEFTAVFDGEKFSKEVVIRNISKKSVEIYLKQPISIAFQIIDNGTKISLAPGLSVKRTVVFQYRPDTLLSSFFTIRIKDALIEIPIFFKRVHTKFSVTPANLDFGKVDVGSPLVSKNVKMENLAAVAAQYKVVIGPNENHIQVIPSKGFIRPNETHMLRVQFYPTVPGQIYHVISVMPSSAKSQGDWRQKHDIFCTITLEADIIKPSLVAIHPNTTGEFTLCDFPLTFSSTTRYDTVAVCNTSAQYATFVVLGEMMNTLFELKSARKINSNYKMFSVQPTEGRIAPFEEIVLKIIYKPSIENEEKGWKYVEENCLQKSHFCFFKIVMVEVKDHIDFNGHEHTSKTDTSSSIDDEADVYNKDMLRSYDSANFSSTQGFRLCLHGLFTSPVLHVTPARLSFTGLRLGGGGDDSSRATVTVANRSLLSLGCRAVAQSYVRVTPALLFLEAGASVEIEVAVAAHAIGTFKRVVKLECLSMENVTDASGQKVIGETKFIVEGNVEVCTKRPQPKLNLGISPKITHEVGFLPEEVTFGSRDVKMPANAIVAVNGGLPRLYNQSDVVAFPNDMPKSLRAQYPEKVFRSIFTGKQRYNPPVDCCLTYSLLEKLKKNKHNEFWLNYMRNAFAKHLKETEARERMTARDVQRLNGVAPLVHLRGYERRVVSQSQHRLQCNLLSPLELYNIKVNPRMLNFNMVAVDTDCEELMFVENLNSFEISMHVISTNSSIKVSGQNHMKISPFAKVSFSIIIHSSFLGLFNGMFKYVINEKHLFEMVVAAEIVEKFLDISTLEVRHAEPKNNPFYMWTEYITLKNHLKSDTEFTWTSKSFRCFDIEPKKGCVPSCGELNCLVTYCPPTSAESEPSSKIGLLIGHNNIDTIKCYCTLTRAHTTFINPTLNLGAVPLNLQVVAKSVLFNATYRKVPFSVSIVNEDGIQGVAVSPMQGFVEGRADVVFTLTFTLLKVGAIDFRVGVLSEGSMAWLKVIGQVVFPKISITPDKVEWFRVPCYTHTACMLTAENQSEAIASLSFLIDQHYHFKISLSPEFLKTNTIDNFSLLPGEKKDFYLHFFPTDLVTHQFYLPVVINNIIGPPDIKLAKTLTPGHFISQFQERKTSSWEKLSGILILCTIAPPPLSFSKVFVKCFGNDEEEDITVTNNQERTAFVGFRLSSANSLHKGFSLECRATAIHVDKKEHVYFYEIEPNDSIKLIVSFSPPEKGFFEEKLLVMHTLEICDVTTCRQPYTQLILHGKTSGDLIASDSIIYFPPIPLEVESVRRLTITKDEPSGEDDSHGQFSLQVIKLSQAAQETLHVSYSEEAAVTKKSISLQVTIGFKSSHPISFKTQLTFRDGSGAQTAVTVIATADNCLLTTHAFSLLKYRAQTDATTHACDTIQYNHVEFVKRSSSVTNLLASDDAAAKSGLERRVMKSQTSLSVTSLAGRQNSSFISHTKNSKYLKLPWQSIPEFPSDQDPAAEYQHMRNVLTAMERHLYGQTFNCSYHWTVGENVKWSAAYHPAEHGAALSNVALIKSLVELLERFCGRDIHTVLPYVNIPFPKDDEARVLKVVALLESVLEYLMRLGACLGHFAADYLLDYHDHEIYCKRSALRLDERTDSVDCRKSSIGNFEIICNPEDMSKEKYEKRMVQCWLDLFLQLYKVCILYSIKLSSYNPEDLKSSKEDVGKNTFKLILRDKKSAYKTSVHSANKRSTESPVFRFRVGSHDRSKHETVLLTWLDDFYTRQRAVVWPHHPPDLRHLDFFDSLSDSLVFAAVTSFYCPYISALYFHNMFTHPTGKDQLYHNAICLLKAWTNIRVGVFVHPSELIDGDNCVLKLMIAVHLFKVLPSYVPETVLDFGTPLTTSKERPIQLTNNSLSQANYFLIMIGDPYRSFIIQSSSNVINIKSKKTVIVNIQYTSNKIRKESATLLFCGSCVSPNFAANRVFTLEGYAEKLKISKVFALEAPLNKIVDRSFKLNAPYGSYTQEYEFELHYSEKKPSVDDPPTYSRWIEVSNRKLPQRIHFPYSALSIPGKGRKFKEFSIKICCFTPKQYDYYFILMNPSVGDFIIQISIKPKVNIVKEPIQLHFEENVSGVANYKEQFADFWAKYSTTPPNAVVRIPCRNDDLWSSLMAMFELKFNANETSFWTSYLETNIGLKLIQWMMGNESDSMTDDIRHIFHYGVSYKVTSSSQSLTVPNALYLPDIKKRGTIDFPVYLNKEDVDTLDKIRISLIAEHGNEIRVYNLIQTENEQ